MRKQSNWVDILEMVWFG